MTDIIITTRGECGRAVLASSELIIGEQENIQALGFYLGESVEHLRDFVLQTTSCTREGSEVLILVDMRSRSPFNVTTSLIKDHTFEHPIGINFPILFETPCSRTQMGLKMTVTHIVSEGMKTLIHVNEMLKED